MVENPLHDAAIILAGWPRLVARLRADHVADLDGRCRGCRSQVQVAPRWPCAIAALAGAAANRHDRGQPPT